MAYLIVRSADGQELARQALESVAVIGRAPDSDVRIHDISLSREHCRLELSEGRWVAHDQGSRNGTFINGQRITSQELHDGDELLAGHTTIVFREGNLVEAPAASRRPALAERPADPIEALSGTVMDFSLDPGFEAPIERSIARALPRPVPVPNKKRHFQQLAGASGDANDSSAGALSSSPTWATKPDIRPRRRLEELGPVPEPQSLVQARPVAQPQVDGHWARRFWILLGQTFLTAAAIGAAAIAISRLL